MHSIGTASESLAPNVPRPVAPKHHKQSKSTAGRSETLRPRRSWTKLAVGFSTVAALSSSAFYAPFAAFATDEDLVKAEQAYKQRDLKTAMKLADAVLRRDGGCARAYSLKAACDMRDKHWSRALINADRAISIDPKLAEPYVIKARSGYLSGEAPTESVQHDLELAVKLNPKVEEGFYCLGIVHMYKPDKNLPLAVTLFSRALELDPSNQDIFKYRASCYAMMGKSELALKDYSSLIALAPREPDGYISRAGIYESKKLFDKALADYALAARFAPNDYNTRMLRAALLSKLGRYEEAASNYSEAMRLNAGEPELCLKRADLYIKLRKHEKALQDINEAIFLAPDSSKGYRARAQLYALLGKSNLAKRDRNRAQSLK